MGMNLGAFAGGLGKGYLAADDMYETRKRTKAIEEETRMRGEQNARAQTEFGWKQKQQERIDAANAEIDAYHKSLPWVKGEDGSINPLDPVNASNNDKLYAQSHIVRGKYSLNTPAEDKLYLDFQKQLEDKGKRQVVDKFLQTKDPTVLESLDPRLKGAQVVVEKSPEQIPINTLVLADGKTKIPLRDFYISLGTVGEHAVAAEDRATSHELQARSIRETAAARAESTAARREAMQIHQQNREDAQKYARSNDILGVTKALHSNLLQRKAKETDPDPDKVYNQVVQLLVDRELKPYSTSKEDTSQLASQVNGIEARVRNQVEKAMPQIDAQARKYAERAVNELAAERKKAKDSKPITERERKALYQQWRWTLANDMFSNQQPEGGSATR